MGLHLDPRAVLLVAEGCRGCRCLPAVLCGCSLPDSLDALVRLLRCGARCGQGSRALERSRLFRADIV